MTSFALSAQISIEEAKLYLDQKAKQLVLILKQVIRKELFTDFLDK